MQKIFIFIFSIFYSIFSSQGMLNLKAFNSVLSPTRAKNDFQKIEHESTSQRKTSLNLECAMSRKHKHFLVGKCKNVIKNPSKIKATLFAHPNELPKNCAFNYERQLKIMLAHQRKMEGMQQKLCSHCNYHNVNKTLSYNVFALKDAFDNEKKYANEKSYTSQHTECEHVMSIVLSLLESIKYLEEPEKIPDKYVNGLLIKLKNEQMRFIGLILWHFIFRQNPIFDFGNKKLIFFAKLTPNIDPSDVLTIGEMVNEMTKKLEDRVDGKTHFAQQLSEKQLFDEYVHDQLLLEQLEQQQHKDAADATAQIPHHQSTNMLIMMEEEEEEKRMELAHKLHLLRSQHLCLVRYHDAMDEQCVLISTPLANYHMIDRAFIAFGKHAPALILLAKALLEGKMDGNQLENYLKNDQNLFNNMTIDDNDYSYITMASQLGKISTDY